MLQYPRRFFVSFWNFENQEEAVKNQYHPSNFNDFSIPKNMANILIFELP